MRAAAYGALTRVVNAIESKHGQLWLDRALLASLSAVLACNEHAADSIGQLIEPIIADAAAAEGYRPLPAQSQSIVMSTKGASASGKSTMRPLQRALAARMGVRWSDFALISPPGEMHSAVPQAQFRRPRHGPLLRPPGIGTPVLARLFSLGRGHRLRYTPGIASAHPRDLWR